MHYQALSPVTVTTGSVVIFIFWTSIIMLLVQAVPDRELVSVIVTNGFVSCLVRWTHIFIKRTIKPWRYYDL
jgi:hypothetical protein